ncbi:MAG: hypothetical protein QM784_11370 [Polyangiaceae bacterium]
MRIGIASLMGCLALAGCDSTDSTPFGTGGASANPNAGATSLGTSTSGAGMANGGNGSVGGAGSVGKGGGSAGTGTATTGGQGQSTNTTPIGPGTYALDPPNQCLNQQSVNNCKKGDTSSACGGVCSSDYGSGSQSACESGKSGVPINFACPRFLLYSDEFMQAAIDDNNTAFNYGIVGHDVDTGGVDGTNTDACCQCYQIIFDYPDEKQAWVDPNTAGTPVSAVPPPKPMIVQAFNTGTAGKGNFDIYMGAGGLGANNGCFSVGGSTSPAGLYQYLGYPSVGQPNDGGVKAVGNFGNGSACKTNTSWVTEATVGSAGCVEKVTAACNEIKAADARMQEASIRSCIKSNDAKSLYHMNWLFWVKRVECPAHLTEVTGCKLASQGLPAPDPAVTTVAQAKAAGFRQKDADGKPYNTTSMEDCCMPTCAWVNNVKGKTVGKYNSFYSCNQAGIPQTE